MDHFRKACEAHGWIPCPICDKKGTGIASDRAVIKSVIIECTPHKTPTEKLKEFLDSSPLNNTDTWARIDSFEEEERNYCEANRKPSGNFYEIMAGIISPRKRSIN